MISGIFLFVIYSAADDICGTAAGINDESPPPGALADAVTTPLNVVFFENNGMLLNFESYIGGNYFPPYFYAQTT